MEETVGNIPGARAIFERWMDWEPEDQYWSTYINFELRYSVMCQTSFGALNINYVIYIIICRYKELERARVIFERFVMIHPDVKNWIRYATFEHRNGFINRSGR